MLTPVAEGVLVHESAFLKSNTIVVQGRDGVLLIDPGVQEQELSCLADDLAALGQCVVAGFSTHPHWDHILWHERLGAPPRLATARCVAAVREQLAAPDAKAAIAGHLAGTEIAGRVPLELLGLVTALPDGATHIPWEGPRVRVAEHQGHAPGHAALLVEEAGVLVAGDMLSDVLVPMFGRGFEGGSPADLAGSYLDGLTVLDGLAAGAAVVVPGHGSVGAGHAGRAVKARIEQDRAYVLALRDGREPDDPRIGPGAAPGWEWVSDLHAGQAHRFAPGRAG